MMTEIFKVSEEELIKLSNYKLNSKSFNLSIREIIQCYPKIMIYLKQEIHEICL